MVISFVLPVTRVHPHSRKADTGRHSRRRRRRQKQEGRQQTSMQTGLGLHRSLPERRRFQQLRVRSGGRDVLAGDHALRRRRQQKTRRFRGSDLLARLC